MTTLRTRQFKKEDFPGLLDVDEKWEDFLAAFNTLGKQLEVICNAGIGKDNLNAQVSTLQIGKSQTYPVQIKSVVKGKPIGVVGLRAVKTTTNSSGDPVGVAWSVDWSVNGATVLLNGLPGLSSAETYSVTLQIVGP